MIIQSGNKTFYTFYFKTTGEKFEVSICGRKFEMGKDKVMG